MPILGFTLGPLLAQVPGAEMALEAAAYEWSRAAECVPAVTVGDEGQPVELGETGKHLAIAIARLSYEDGPILACDIIVSHDVVAPGSQFDLQSILTHEIGHCLGLGDDRTDPERTMYYQTAPGNIEHRTLEQADLDEAECIYDDLGDDGGCSVGGRHVGSPWLILAAFAAARRKK